MAIMVKKGKYVVELKELASFFFSSFTSLSELEQMVFGSDLVSPCESQTQKPFVPRS